MFGLIRRHGSCYSPIILKGFRSSYSSSFVRQKVTLPSKESIIPRFQFLKNTHTIDEISSNVESLWGESVTLSGWIDKKPKKLGKNIVFADFRDFEGNFTQIISKNPDFVSTIRKSQIEDCVNITGKIIKRFSKQSDQEDVRWDLEVQDYKILNSSDIITSQLESLKSTPSDFPQQYRYLQLRLPFYQRALETRSKVSLLIRNELNKEGFTEIETPLLFKSTPEGASEFLVPTRRPDLFYALPQSPQQYKQLLMASGVKKYFQIAKCFRDEDLRSDRQPEFTQVDLEMSFANAADVQNVIENLVRQIWANIANEPIHTIREDGEPDRSSDFIHLSYEEVLSKYGIDKPDLRSNVTIQDLSLFAVAIENENFPIFEVCVLEDAFKDKVKPPSKLFDVNEYNARRPIIIPINTQDDVENWYKKFSHLIQINDLEGLKSSVKLNIGDIIAGSTRAKLSYENPTPLGRFRQLAIQEFPNKWRKDVKFIAAWIEDFPLFTPVETQEGKTDYPAYDFEQLESTHHPFTMCKLEDYDNLATYPLDVKGEHYDLVLNGVELGGGSRRIHDSKLQEFVLKEILKIEKTDELFGHLLKALSLGCPPHAGIALGFDRLCAMLIGSSSIRDVVAFPKTSNGSDLVVESPSSLSDEVLQKYHIKKVSLD